MLAREPGATSTARLTTDLGLSFTSVLTVLMFLRACALSKERMFTSCPVGWEEARSLALRGQQPVTEKNSHRELAWV